MNRRTFSALSLQQTRSGVRALNSISTVFRRHISSASSNEAVDFKPDIVPDARWLSNTGPRIGKCLTFGCSPGQVSEAGTILRQLAASWRDLVAGSEGFLTGEGRRGLWKHNVVWGDQDLMVSWALGHVNNVTYLRYCESARVNWVNNYARVIDPTNRKAWQDLPSARGKGVILRGINIEYKFPMKYPDRICVFHKIRSLPEAKDNSLFLDVLILSEKHRRPVARALEDIVLYNYPKAQKMSMSEMPFMLDVFRRTFELQEEAINVNRQRAQAIEQRIRALERETWDRPDAVEDFGGSGAKG